MLIQRCALIAALLAATAGPANTQDLPEVLRPHAREWERLVAAEDARARTPEQLALILETTRATEPELRRLAVRALGRLERSVLVDSVALLLRDPAPRVRAEAAHALAQAATHGEIQAARSALLSALGSERDPVVVSALVESLGRLRHATIDEVRATVTLLLPHFDGATALGTARGLFFLARQPVARRALDPATRAALLRQARSSASTNPEQTRLRTVAAATWVATGAPDAANLGDILRDADPFVRREGAVGLGEVVDTAAAAPLVLSALEDTSGIVRYEALRVYGRQFAVTRGCTRVREHVDDESLHVMLLAIDLLGSACPAEPRTISVLDSITRLRSASAVAAWHPGAHALVALAARAPEVARRRLSGYAAHPNFFARAYAAVAAASLRELRVLQALSNDTHPNVRAAAVSGLSRVVGHAADSIYLRQLGQNDSQLLMATAAALDSTTHPAAAAALLATLDRISAARRETSRDARDALLQRVWQLGSAALVDRVRPYLRDFDSRIAARAADVIQAWTGSRPEPEPQPLPAPATTSFADAVTLARTPVVILLATGGEIELQLLPFAAPTNAARFARLARAGYYDGLTFHRIAPNFVVQGGSPNANEYAGDGPFSRDELGLENWRGTVGLSTRGRDTGDAQLYINLVDNVRLDHDYTVFGRVVSGMNLVDRLLEGVVMRRVR